MTQYTRRKLLRDIGVSSAGLALPWTMGCRCSHASDLYLVLNGPWLLSIANDRYLRAVTININNSTDQPTGSSHWYYYHDPRKNPDSPCCVDLEQSRMTHFEVSPYHNRLWTKVERSRLFDSMRTASQGLFYTSDVQCPDVFDCSLNPIEIQLSYPDFVFPMGLHTRVTFSNLSAVQGQVSQWPSAIVLRYCRWKTAKMYGENLTPETISRGRNQVHRTMSVKFVHSQEPDPCLSDSNAAAHAVMVFGKLMGLLKFPTATVPAPAFPTCRPNTHIDDPIMPGGDGSVDKAELDALPPCRHDVRGTDLTNCASGGGGVHGCC